MSGKRKRGNIKLDVVEKTEEIEVIKTPKVVEKPKLSFQAWFLQKVKTGELRYYQDEALLVYFGKQGLTKLEYPDTYNEYFKKF